MTELIVVIIVCALLSLNLTLTIACIDMARTIRLLRLAHKEIDPHASVGDHAAAGGAVGDRDWVVDRVAGS